MTSKVDANADKAEKRAELPATHAEQMRKQYKFSS